MYSCTFKFLMALLISFWSIILFLEALALVLILMIYFNLKKQELYVFSQMEEKE